MRSKKSFLQIFSLVFAFLSWIYVLSSAEIQVEKSVKLEYVLPDDMAISSQPINEVHYTLSGPRAFIRNLLGREDIIKIDMRSKYRKKQKMYELNMQNFSIELPFGVNVVDVEPRKMQLELSPMLAKEVRIQPVLVGEIASDQKLLNQSIEPKTIKLKGPRELISHINEIETTPIDLQGLNGKGQKEVQLVALDPRIQMSMGSTQFHYEVIATRANMILRKIPIRFLSSKMIKNANRRFVTLMVLADKGSEEKLSLDDVKVVAEVPERRKGTIDVALKATLPEGVHLLDITPPQVRVVVED